ncbi:hypothetical protein JCM3770_003913 [Rhodotorula araucariae]
MDVEELPETQEVLDAVSSLRSSEDGARMQLDLPWEGDGAGPLSGDPRPVVVVDTNVLISHLAVLREFVDLCSVSPSHRPLLLVPHIVVAELDGLKSSSRPADSGGGPSDPRRHGGIASLARGATTWLLHALAPGETSAVIRGQRRGETLFGAEGAPFGENNDSLVLDAALYHAHRNGARVVLLTDDKNLQLRATIEQVEAFGLDDGTDAPWLLERLASGPRARDGRYARAPSSLEKSRYGPPAKTRRRRSSPPISPLPPLVAVPATPVHLAHRPPTPSMDLDLPTPPPLHLSFPPPVLYLARSAPDIFRNVCLLVSHFLALPLYRHTYGHLRHTRIAEQAAWEPALGDWREWGARECVDVARRWWTEGNVEALCRVGIEAAAALGSTPPAPPWPGSSVSAARARSAPASTSRWAAPPSPRVQPAPTLAAHPTVPLRAQPTVSQRLDDLHASLPVLASTLAVPPQATVAWSAPRWEVLLEGVGALLCAVLGGAVRGDVKGEVGQIVGEWVDDLARLGLRVDIEA